MFETNINSIGSTTTTTTHSSNDDKSISILHDIQQNKEINIQEVEEEEEELDFCLIDKLHELILNSNEDKFFKYIERMKENEEIDFDKKFSNKMTLLHLSCSKNQISICEVLIKKGCNINALDGQSRIPLHIASSHGYHDLCILLLGNGSKINIRDLYGYSPIILALKSHHFNLIQDLQLFGGDINFKRGLKIK